MPLAPPFQVTDRPKSPCPQQGNGNVEDPSLRSRIALHQPCTLASFVEPLDILLEIVEIDCRMSHFEGIVQNVTTTVQNISTLNVQCGIARGMDQRNKRNCVRAITQAAATRCPVAMEETHQYLTISGDFHKGPSQASD
ncbi:hypothetical protein TNCT_166731 [Trichonephila clavata]|uniref:Uncharacterized protein n=1 Tax=Trichonephila clavata TaxID=2740835 RepID=A0A8X6G784_TRICU|nr:hypothetical protein TNCT_166731 [Trichonephila clavata]